MRTLALLLLVFPFFINSQSFVDSVYEFDVGDEFHYLYTYTMSGNGSRVIKTIKKVIGKQINGTSVKYTYHTYGSEELPNTPIRKFSYIDTINYNNYLDTIFDTIPPCLDSTHPYYDSITTAAYRRVFCNYIDTIVNDPNLNITYKLNYDAGRYFRENYFYSKFLGRINQGESYVDGSPSSYNQSDVLVYFKKNVSGNTWGTPWTFTSSINDINSLEFSIYPNPTSNSIKISGLENIKTNYEMLNSLGKLVVSGTLESREIDCSTLPNGIYFFKLIDSEQNMGIKRIVVSK